MTATGGRPLHAVMALLRSGLWLAAGLFLLAFALPGSRGMAESGPVAAASLPDHRAADHGAAAARQPLDVAAALEAPRAKAVGGNGPAQAGDAPRLAPHGLAAARQLPLTAGGPPPSFAAGPALGPRAPPVA